DGLLHPAGQGGGLAGVLNDVLEDAAKAVADDILKGIPTDLLKMLPASLALGLQQCRDPQQSSNASHQAIVETTIQIPRLYTFKAVAAPGEFQLTDLASHPVRADLGVSTQAVPFALYFRADSLIAGGEVVWRAP